MPTIRFTLDEEHAKLLEEDAQRAGQTVQDYIRLRLFPTTAATVFTPQEAVRRALAKYKRGPLHPSRRVRGGLDHPAGDGGGLREEVLQARGDARIPHPLRGDDRSRPPGPVRDGIRSAPGDAFYVSGG